MNILLLLLLEAIIIGLFVSMTIQMSIALANCKGLRKDIQTNDNVPGSKALQHAQQAQNLLGWGVAIGWSGIGLAVLAIVLLVIVEIFGGAEVEGGAAIVAASTAEGAALLAEGEGGAALLAEGVELETAAQM